MTGCKRVGTNYKYMEAREDCVVIVRRCVRIFGKDNVSEVVVFYRDITSVVYKPERLFACGYLEIKCAGNTYDPERDDGEKYIDPYCITFTSNKTEEEVKEFKKYIEKKVSEAKKQSVSNVSAANELLKYKKLLDAGAISKAEFDAKKRQLLKI